MSLNIITLRSAFDTVSPAELFFSISRNNFYRMHSIISMVGIVLTGKENYPEWFRMIKHTLIFNELWKGLCVGDGDNEPVQPTSDKELVIWENKNSKAYALITTSINEEVSHHIFSY